ncbi:hypothetical protein BJ742DRAFT_736583 [Cladochytrium replicatum]|nr:hypothetical protein BJ742DRAFT_736583 [Cladochytrium replicatum]
MPFAETAIQTYPDARPLAPNAAIVHLALASKFNRKKTEVLLVARAAKVHREGEQALWSAICHKNAQMIEIGEWCNWVPTLTETTMLSRFEDASRNPWINDDYVGVEVSWITAWTLRLRNFLRFEPLKDSSQHRRNTDIGDKRIVQQQFIHDVLEYAGLYL